MFQEQHIKTYSLLSLNRSCLTWATRYCLLWINLTMNIEQTVQNWKIFTPFIYISKNSPKKIASWLVKNGVSITQWKHRPSTSCWHNDGGCKDTVPLKSKLPLLVSFLARRVSFLSRRFSFLASRISFLSRITEAFSMAYITRKKPVTGNDCRSAVCCQIDGTVQHKICIDHLLDSYRTKVILNIERNYK